MQRVQRLMQQALLVLPFLAQTPQVQVKPLQGKAQVQPAPTGLTHKQLVVVRKQQKPTRQQVSQTPLARLRLLLLALLMQPTQRLPQVTVPAQRIPAPRQLQLKQVLQEHLLTLRPQVRRLRVPVQLTLRIALELPPPAPPLQQRAKQRLGSRLLLRLLKQIRQPQRLAKHLLLLQTQQHRKPMRRGLLALHRVQ